MSTKRTTTLPADDFETVPWPIQTKQDQRPTTDHEEFEVAQRPRKDDFEVADLSRFADKMRRNGSYRSPQKRRRPACFEIPKFFEAKSDDCKRCAFYDWCHKKYDLAIAYLAEPGDVVLSDDGYGLLKQEDLPTEDKHGVLAIIRRRFLDTYMQSLKETRKREAVSKRDIRSKRKLDRMEQIEEEAVRRTRCLKEAISEKRRNRRVEQLVGREEEIISFWKAMQIALVRIPKASDRKIAQEISTVSCKPFTKDQVRARRLLISRLEATGEVWSAFQEPKIASS